MHSFPHHYQVTASGNCEGSVTVAGPEMPKIETYPPPEFNGPKGYWSPETLLMASVADCFILSFRGVARASNLEWKTLSCNVEGVLDKEGKVTRFTRLSIKPTLTLQNTDDRKKAEQCLEKAERNCLITNSLNTENELLLSIETVEAK